MNDKLIFAKLKDSNVIYNIVFDDGNFVDLSIDDIQGDIVICGIDKKSIVLVEETDYLKKIEYLENEAS